MDTDTSSDLFSNYSLRKLAVLFALISLLFYFYFYFLEHVRSFSSNRQKSIKKRFQKKCLEISGQCNDLGRSIFYLDEIISIFKIKFGGQMKIGRDKSDLNELATSLNDRDFCYATLNKVSRSFSLVIEQLPEQLKDAVCIFYLVLRGLDSVEDDMNYPQEKKILLLRSFHENLSNDHWSISHVGDTQDYQILLENFSKVIQLFKSLDRKYQSVIVDITRQMGYGMADFVTKNGSIDTIDNYNLYCHYVAGLVGHGLSSLFAHSGLEDESLDHCKDLSNSMGLFLQKTNIIRDYLEDLQAGRTWWPKEIWQNYADDLSQFRLHPYVKQSVQCLDEMVINALNHLPHVIDYLRRLRHPQIFEFCAIPQVMAMATLAQLYHNPLVLTSVVKIRKGLTCKLMLNSSNLAEVCLSFNVFLKQIEKKIPNDGTSNSKRMQQLVQQIKNFC